MTLPTVFAHRDVGATECPGNTGIRSMPTIRSRTAALVGNLATYPIRQKWLAQRSVLAEPSVVESPTSKSARVTRFSGSNGAVYWSSATGAWSVQGVINSRYDALGAAGSVLGLPRTDEKATPDGRGRYNQFQSGVVYWTSATGAWPVRGPILTRWAQLGSERSSLGYPTGDQFAVTGGVRQNFERGYLRLNTTLRGRHDERVSYSGCPIAVDAGTTTYWRRQRSVKTTGPRGPGTWSTLMPVSGTRRSLTPSSRRVVAFQKAPVPA